MPNTPVQLFDEKKIKVIFFFQVRGPAPGHRYLTVHAIANELLKNFTRDSSELKARGSCSYGIALTPALYYIQSILHRYSSHGMFPLKIVLTVGNAFFLESDIIHIKIYRKINYIFEKPSTRCPHPQPSYYCHCIVRIGEWAWKAQKCDALLMLRRYRCTALHECARRQRPCGKQQRYSRVTGSRRRRKADDKSARPNAISRVAEFRPKPWKIAENGFWRFI